MRFLYRSRRKGKQLREAKRQMKLSRQTSVGVWNDKLASNKPEYTFETRAPFSLYVYTLGDSKRKKKKKRRTTSLIKKKKKNSKEKIPKKTRFKHQVSFREVFSMRLSIVKSIRVPTLRAIRGTRAINVIDGNRGETTWLAVLQQWR